MDLQLNNYLALAQDQIRFLQTETILNHDNGSNGSLAQFGSNQSQNSSVAGNAAIKGSNGSLAQFGSNQNQNSSVAGNAAIKGSNGSLAQFGSNQNHNSSVAGNAATK